MSQPENLSDALWRLLSAANEAKIIASDLMFYAGGDVLGPKDEDLPEDIAWLHNALVTAESRLRDHCTNDLILELRQANPYPAINSGYCRESFTEIVVEYCEAASVIILAHANESAYLRQLRERCSECPGRFVEANGIASVPVGGQQVADVLAELRPSARAFQHVDSTFDQQIQKEFVRATGEQIRGKSAGEDPPKGILTLSELLEYPERMVRTVAEAYQNLSESGDVWFTIDELEKEAGYGQKSLARKSRRYQRLGILVKAPNGQGFRVGSG